MKYIKAYELFSFLKKKEKIVEPSRENIVDRYTVDDILDMFTEFNDDFNLNMSKDYIKPCHLVSSKSKQMKNVWYKDFKSIDGKQYFMNQNEKTKDLHNSYAILLDMYEGVNNIIDEESIVNIMNHKKELYNFDYILVDKTFAVNPQTGLPMKAKQWRIFII